MGVIKGNVYSGLTNFQKVIHVFVVFLQLSFTQKAGSFRDVNEARQHGMGRTNRPAKVLTTS